MSPKTRSALPPSFRIGEFGWIWLATAALFVLSGILAPGTVRPASIAAMLPFAAMLAIVASGQTIVIQQRGLDLSSAGLMSLGGIFAAKMAPLIGVPMGVVSALALAALIGAVNGFLIARIAIMPIVATLATNAIILGAILQISGGSPLAAPPEMERLSHERLFGVPLTLVFALVFVMVLAFVLARTSIGRRFIAVGANPRTARAAGMPVLTYQIGTYCAAAVCFAFAGVLYAGFVGSASHIAGNDYLLPSIAAVVVGGTPFTGGRGSVIASSVAAIFMTQLGIMVLALGASSAVQLLVQCLVIVIACSLQMLPTMMASLRKRRNG